MNAADPNANKIHKPYKKRYVKITPEELYDKFNDYLDLLDYETAEDGKRHLPTLAGLCNYAWISTDTLRRYGHDEDYKDVTEYITLSIEEKLRDAGNNMTNSKFIEYQLNNRWSNRWSNKQIIETKEIKSLSTKAEQDEALIEVEAELKRLTQDTKTPLTPSE